MVTTGKLTNKRKQLNQNGHYICDVECSNCGKKVTVAFSGWSALNCLGCKQDMERGTYEKQ